MENNMSYKMLVLNMGSTSTKVAVYRDEEKVWQESLEHPREEITKFPRFLDQYDYRKQAILNALAGHGEQLGSFDVFVSRGGTTKPIPGGVWTINEAMLEDAWSGLYGDHPCTLGGQISYDFAREMGRRALTVDSPNCSELSVLARYSGLPEIERIASFHNLNQRAIAKRFARETGRDYKSLNLIVAHMGGGVSVGAHAHGQIVDVNNALAGDGPFAMERAGTIPSGDLIRMCYSGKFSEAEVLRRVNGRGGVFAYLGLTDARKIQERIDQGDAEAKSVSEAMAYQIAKEIGGLATVFQGKVDAILLTAGLAHWKFLVDRITEAVEFIAPVKVYPGENEMASLAEGVYRGLTGQEPVQEYK